jgi:hypothetical protein
MKQPFVLPLALFLAALSAVAAEIDLQSLLREMADRDRLAQLPNPDYRCLQASSYNRASVPPLGSEGWFADSDGVGFIREERSGGRKEWVIMEHDGPGCLTKFWTPYFYYDLNNHRGPNIRIYLDGAEEPVISGNFIELLTRGEYEGAPAKENAFTVPRPFAGYTARAGDLYLPIPFAKGCKVTLDKKPFYNIVNYRAYPEGAAVATFTGKAYAAAQPLLKDIGAALEAAAEHDGGTVLTLNRTIAPGRREAITLPEGSHAVRHLEMRLGPDSNAQRLRSTVLRMTCDGGETIWVPAGDFFCSGDSVNVFHTWERSVATDGTMTCRWVMPYRDSAEITLENLGSAPVEAALRVRVAEEAWDEARSMHFHAHWRTDEPVPGTPFLDWNFVDIQGRGVYVGDAWTVLSPGTGWWGEGDEKIYIDGNYDGAKFPSHFGTGSEDYYGWAGGVVPTGADAFSAPFLSNVRIGNAANPRGYNICTRSRVLDAIPFSTRLRFDMEASAGTDIRNPWDLLHYSVVTYWYARPGVVHNRTAQADVAAKPVMTAEELDAREQAIKKSMGQP